jgi:hypothetical protein
MNYEISSYSTVKTMRRRRDMFSFFLVDIYAVVGGSMFPFFLLEVDRSVERSSENSWLDRKWNTSKLTSSACDTYYAVVVTKELDIIMFNMANHGPPSQFVRYDF